MRLSIEIEYEIFTPQMASWICAAGSSAEGIDAEKMRQIVSIGRFPADILTGIGCEDLEIVTTISVFEKMVFDHGIGTDILSRFHSILCAPKQIFNSASRPGSVVVVTLEIQRGNPIIIPIQLSKPVGKYQPNVHWVSSAYAKDNPRQLQKWEKDGLLLWGTT